MKTSTTKAQKPAGLTPQQIRTATSISLTGDLLERGLQSRFCDLHILLLLIIDSGLLDSDKDLSKEMRRLADKAETLLMEVRTFYHESSFGGASYLLSRDGVGLLQEVAQYRQEQFWLKKKVESLVASETLIAALFSFYEEVDIFLREIDSLDEDTVHFRKHGAPKYTPNPYENVGGQSVAI